MDGVIINIIADEKIIGYSQECHFWQREDVHELLNSRTLEGKENEGEGYKLLDFCIRPFLFKIRRQDQNVF